MNGVAVARHLVLVLALGSAATAQTFRFTPPRLVKAELPPVPSPMVIGGGEVLIEALVDARGFPTRPTVLRGTHALHGSVVLYELTLDQGGRVTESRSVASLGGYEGATRDALSAIPFRAASYRARPVETRAYLLFGFRPVTVSNPMSPSPSPSPKP
jgi:hypothetical protein